MPVLFEPGETVAPRPARTDDRGVSQAPGGVPSAPVPVRERERHIERGAGKVFRTHLCAIRVGGISGEASRAECRQLRRTPGPETGVCRGDTTRATLRLPPTDPLQPGRERGGIAVAPDARGSDRRPARRRVRGEQRRIRDPAAERVPVRDAGLINPAHVSRGAAPRRLAAGHDRAPAGRRLGEEARRRAARIRHARNFRDTYCRLWWDRPPGTITTHFGMPSSSRCIHPKAARVLPLARPPGSDFPDHYLFVGGRAARNAKIANAVPPVLAKALASAIAAHCRQGRP